MTLNHVVAGSIPAVGAHINIFIFFFLFINSANSSVARIPRCQRGGPGSIPGWRKIFIYLFIFLIILNLNIYLNLYLIYI